VRVDDERGSAAGMRSAGNGAVMNLWRRWGADGDVDPGRACPRRPTTRPVAITTAGASNVPAAVVTPPTRSPWRMKPLTSCCCLITTPRSPRAGRRSRSRRSTGRRSRRAAVVGGAEQIAGVEIGTQRAARRRGGRAAPRRRRGCAAARTLRRAVGQLLSVGDQDEVAVLPKVRIDAETRRQTARR